MPLKTICKLFLFLFWVNSASAHLSFQDKRAADEEISRIYHIINPSLPLPDRIEKISAEFLTHPYELGALGEGNEGKFDQMPRYRTDAFDCETFVDTVLALSFANNLKQFQTYINLIRYHHGQVEYTKRNHFTCLDWNQNNQRQGFLKDITWSIDRKKVKFAKALIDKPNWYRHHTLKNIKLIHDAPSIRQKRLEELKQAGNQLSRNSSAIPYIPLTALFDASGRAHHALFQKIPNGSIIEIIRPNWDLTSTIGTHLNVSHLGFAIWQNGTLYFREASTEQGKVVDIPLEDYLHAAHKSPTIKGINIQQPLAQKLLNISPAS